MPHFIEIMDRQTDGHLRPTSLGRLRRINLKTGRVTLTTPLLGAICHRRLEFHSLPACKFDISSFRCSRDIIGASKFKVDHMALTMPFLSVVCHPYAGT